MVSRVLSSLVCVLCVILLPAVWADYCSSYRDMAGYSHDAQQCGSMYCCGDCNHKYCCSDWKQQLSQEKQQHCSGRPNYDKKNKIGTLLGSILGSVFPIILCVGLVICCVAPCCLFYKKCRKGRNQRNQTVVNVPNQPLSPFGNQPSHPGYQLTPTQPGFGGLPFPTAPPTYEVADPGRPPGAFTPGMQVIGYPGQPYAPPPNSNELAPLPYNPSYPSYP